MIRVAKTFAGIGSLAWNGSEHEGWVDVVIPAQIDVLVLVAQSSYQMNTAKVGDRGMQRVFFGQTSNISALAIYELRKPPAGLRRVKVLQGPGYVAVMAMVMLRGVDLQRPRISGVKVGSSGQGQFVVFAPSEQGALVVGGVSIDIANGLSAQLGVQTSLYSGVGYQSSSVFGAAYRRATGTSTMLAWFGTQTFNRSAAVAYRSARWSPLAVSPRVGVALAQSLVSSDGTRARATGSGAILRMRLG